VTRQAALEEFASVDSDASEDGPTDDETPPEWGRQLIDTVETLSTIVEETTHLLDEHQRADVDDPEIRWYQ
jgi:hypothetical protein